MYFDIGANLGNWALANIDKTDKIISVEASPITFKRLVWKIQDEPNIIPVNYAVCNNDGKDITFYHADADYASTLNKDWLTSPESRFHNYQYREIVCKTITIDKLIEQYGVPELIKVDVEAAEYECITSLTQKVPCLCFEWASEYNNIAIKCMGYLVGLGFTEFALQYKDEYNFCPSVYYTVDIITEGLLKTTPKLEWGMVWAK